MKEMIKDGSATLSTPYSYTKLIRHNQQTGYVKCNLIIKEISVVSIVSLLKLVLQSLQNQVFFNVI